MLFAGNLLAVIIFMILSRKEKSDSGAPLSKTGVWIYKRFRIFCMGKGRWRHALEHSLCTDQVAGYLQAMNPRETPQISQAQYYIGKISQTLLIFLAGNLLGFGLWISQGLEEGLVDGVSVQRTAPGTGGVEKEMLVRRENGTKVHRTIHIAARQYAMEELECLYDTMLPELEKEILGGNRSLEDITHDMHLPEQMTGYPFAISWSSSNYKLIDDKGRLAERLTDWEGESAELTADITCQTFARRYAVGLKIGCPALTQQEEWEEALDIELEESDRASAQQEQWMLPQEAGGEELSWEKKRDNTAYLLFFLTVAAACGTYLLKDRDLRKQLARRQEEMMEEYAVLVSKLALFLGAGMTVRSAWRKIAGDYRDRGSGRIEYTYEEMLCTLYEIEGGMPEGAAYERFGRRCRAQPYIKLSALLGQNLKKGNAALVSQLREEAGRALEEKKNSVRKKGEEINTKMLLPMTLLLGMIMIWIIMPAMSAFG